MTRHLLTGKPGGRLEPGPRYPAQGRAGLNGPMAGQFRGASAAVGDGAPRDLVPVVVRHRGAVVEWEQPAGLRNTFALREFAALVDSVDGGCS